MTNPLIKNLIYLILIMSILIVGCREEDNAEPSKISEMVETYSGETFFESGWSLASGKITKQHSDTLLMDYWRVTSGDPIKLFVTGNKIKTINQIFPTSGHLNNHWYEYYMDYRVSIQGYFRNHSIHYTFEEEIKQECDSFYRHYDSGRTELHKANI